MNLKIALIRATPALKRNREQCLVGYFGVILDYGKVVTDEDKVGAKY